MIRSSRRVRYCKVAGSFDSRLQASNQFLTICKRAPDAFVPIPEVAEGSRRVIATPRSDSMFYGVWRLPTGNFADTQMRRKVRSTAKF